MFTHKPTRFLNEYSQKAIDICKSGTFYSKENITRLLCEYSIACELDSKVKKERDDYVGQLD